MDELLCLGVPLSSVHRLLQENNQFLLHWAQIVDSHAFDLLKKLDGYLKCVGNCLFLFSHCAALSPCLIPQP